ncbi:hypothetical protein BN7_5900 [Wickerhamomyces ciferrii]|uniref:Uncharacterized protein n=1 Tax=Wickerhamomyces ciferrii (strain ATCC 14091 / BCRC 22168 / CBS 111 / JCM 3599 / NBRC 0793 / NRRL Y-1031 F-60-10) TaxID=1206466 RepID=K0KZ00_WICCF|nr:uncharacterized protein BN7_5900 [Wickerhamomyces ciferrii]CCH46308.1 hypothetical protein BN7_5900 [Wickerhamomyces ciferrii]
MVSKLSFKGDKPKTKKKTVKRTTRPISTKPDIDVPLIENSWTSATTFTDLNGPLIITTYERSNDDYEHLTQQPLVLTPDILGDIRPSKEVRIVDQTETINFETDDIDPLVYHANIHKTEPGDVQQVFLATSVAFATLGGDVNPNRTKLALKTPSDKYLSLNDQGDVDCKNEAIGPYQILEFEKHVISKEGVWFKIWNGNKRLSLLKNEDKFQLKFKSNDQDDQIISDLFVIRVQTKNSTTGKRLLREHEESKTLGSDSISLSIRNAINSLQKSGIEVNQSTIQRLKNAALKGKLNEQLILERSKSKSDTRC